MSLPPERLKAFRADPFALRMGFALEKASVGYARVGVDVTPDDLNFAGVPHGGLLFSLADYAFAVASNSHGRVAVATSVTIQFLAAAQPGQRLVAEARETQLTERAGFYDMTVSTEGGTVVARCLGVVHRTGRTLPDQPPS